jgi:hypothetical protein
VTFASSADEAEVRPVFGAHPGYLFNVVEEKDRRDVEMVMLPKPKPPPKPIAKVIFDEKLTKEFQDQYRFRFGETQAEQVINNPTRDEAFTYYNVTNLSAQQYQFFQQQFGNYMVRRLIEYHFDNWAKTDPDFRPVYQAKDRFSNLDVKVKEGYKLKWKYNLSGPSMEASLENPYKVETRVQFMMTGVLSKPNEVIYSVGKQVTPAVKVAVVVKEMAKLEQIVFTRKMSKHITMSFTASAGLVPNDPNNDYQNLYLVGFGWSE